MRGYGCHMVRQRPSSTRARLLSPAVLDPYPEDEILEGALVVEPLPGQALVEQLASCSAELDLVRGSLRVALALLSQWLMYDVGCAAPPRGPSLELVRGWVRAERAVAAAGAPRI